MGVKHQKKPVINSFETVERLVNEHIDVARIEACKYASSLGYDQAFSIAMERLQYAAERYTTVGTKGCSFKTFAVQKIKWGLIDYWNHLGRKDRGRDLTVLSLDCPINKHHDDDLFFKDILVDENRISDEVSAVMDDIEKLKICLQFLDERTLEIFRLYYFDDFRLREIADMKGVTESRISQIVKCRLTKLRYELMKML